MPDSFPIVQVPEDAGESVEAMGSKRKFWYRDSDMGRALYKQARAGTGEDWAEKAAAELAELLGLPHARVELATWRGERGTVSPSFVPPPPNGWLVHGNEILLSVVPGYPQTKPGTRHFYRVPQHTLGAVLDVMSARRIAAPLDWQPPAPALNAQGVFVGYLLLDAWIGNTDRHHENWAFVVRITSGDTPAVGIHLAPTYDHASSLGRNESDEQRQRRLAGRDPAFSVRAYVEKATSALYAEAGDAKPLTTFAAFVMAAERNHEAAAFWLGRLAAVEPGKTRALLERLPTDRISTAGIEFAQAILMANRDRLLLVQESFK